MDSSYLLERLDCLQIYSENQGSKYIGLMALPTTFPGFVEVDFHKPRSYREAFSHH